MPYGIRTGIRKFLKKLRKAYNMIVNRPLPDGHAQIFDNIYIANEWATGSGEGSREEVTRDYREFLQKFMRDYRIKSVVDLGCGDWQFSRHIDWNGIKYTGVDVSKIVLKTSKKFAAANIKFLHADVMRNRLPSADLLLAKDVLQHWSLEDIHQFIPKLKKYRYALITNGFPESILPLTNAQKPTGGNHRPIDLGIAPFHLRGEYIFSFEADELKKAFLWINPQR